MSCRMELSWKEELRETGGGGGGGESRGMSPVLVVVTREGEESDWSRWELRPFARAITAYW